MNIKYPWTFINLNDQLFKILGILKYSQITLIALKIHTVSPVGLQL